MPCSSPGLRLVLPIFFLFCPQYGSAQHLYWSFDTLCIMEFGAHILIFKKYCINILFILILELFCFVLYSLKFCTWGKDFILLALVLMLKESWLLLERILACAESRVGHVCLHCPRGSQPLERQKQPEGERDFILLNHIRRQVMERAWSRAWSINKFGY